MAATVAVGGETKAPKADIRILGIQIDTKLRWGPHNKKIQEKMVTQTRAFTKITASTWGADLCTSKARLLRGNASSHYLRGGYLAFSSRDQRCKKRDDGEISSHTKQVSTGIQSNAYWSIAYGNHGNPHARTPLTYCRQMLDYASRLGGQAAVIRKECKKVAAKLRKRGTAASADTPGSQKTSGRLV